MPDNLAALVAAGTEFRIFSLNGGEGNHFAGVGPQRIDPRPIFLNLPNGTTVWQFLVSIQNAGLIACAVVGRSQGK
jgi:outer membrane protein assembly factor BamB